MTGIVVGMDASPIPPGQDGCGILQPPILPPSPTGDAWRETADGVTPIYDQLAAEMGCPTGDLT